MWLIIYHTHTQLQARLSLLALQTRASSADPEILEKARHVIRLLDNVFRCIPKLFYAFWHVDYDL